MPTPYNVSAAIHTFMQSVDAAGMRTALGLGTADSPTWKTAAIATGSLSGASSPALAITQTWSNAGTTFKGVTLTITDTNSASGSLPFQILGGVSGTTNLLSIDKSGNAVMPAIQWQTSGTTKITQSYAAGSMGSVLLHQSTTDQTTGIKFLGMDARRAEIFGSANSITGYNTYWATAFDAPNPCFAAYSSNSATLYFVLHGGNAGAGTAHYMELRNSTNAQNFCIYNTYSSSTSYERLRTYGGGAGDFSLLTEAGSSGGTIRGLVIGTGNAVGSNAVGANTTIVGGAGTGQGAGGSIVFRTAPASAGSGSSANSLSTWWTLGQDGSMAVTNGTLTTSTPALAISQTWNNAGTTFKGLTLNVTNTNSAQGSKLIELNFGGTEYFSIRNETGQSGTNNKYALYTPLFTARDFYGSCLITNGTGVNNGIKIGYGNPGYLDIHPNQLLFVGALGNSYITNDGYDLWAIRNSTTAQSLAVYNTYSSATSYERLAIDWKTTSNLMRIVTEAGSAGGTTRGMLIGSGAAVGSDAVGADTKIVGGQGTGTGAGGSILLQCAAASGSSGTTVNSLSTKVTISSGGVNISGNTTFGGLVVVNDAYGFLLGSTTGSQLATGASQKLAFWGATPVTQRASASQAAVTDTAGATYTSAEQTMLANLKTLVNQIRSDLVTIGIIKGSA